MQRKFIKKASYVITIAMLVTIVIVFIFQTATSYRAAGTDLNGMLSEVERQLEENDVQIAELTESMGADYLARARAFSYMILENPKILESSAELERIMKALDVDELHVTDEKGVIRWGTVPDYFGFDMNSSEQTAAFIPILKDASVELAQEPQLNAAAGILFQYIGVSRMDKSGIVQIGMQPSRLEEALKNNEIGRVLERYCDKEQSAFAVSREDGTVVWHSNEKLIGQPSEEIGMKGGAAKLVGSYRNVSVDGKRLRCTAKEIGDYLIVAGMTQSAFMASRNVQILLLIFSDILVVIVMVDAIRKILKKQIVLPIQEIAGNLNEIREGNLEKRVDITVCPEFQLLSDDINAMVTSIREKITEAESLLEEQKRVSEEVRTISATLYTLSDGNMATADNLSNSSEEQASVMDTLTENIDQLSIQMKADGEKAALAGSTSEDAEKILEQGVTELEELANVMRELNQKSKEIQNVVKVIDDISFQTNILALNAAVEAARAGEAGKGFAVVADEVRNLAGKSAESAKQTADMVGETTRIMQAGEDISARASEISRTAMEKSRQSNTFTSEIVEASQRQSEIVEQILDAAHQVQDVVNSNSGLAEEAKEGVAQLLTEIQNLRRLSGNPEAQ